MSAAGPIPLTFKTIAVSGQSDIVADSPQDTLTVAQGAGITLTTNATTDTLTITNSSPSSGGTVTTVSVVTANGVSGSVANPTTTPAITLVLGDITPSKVNGNVITTGTGTLTLSTFTLTVAGTASVSGTNTGDQTSVSGNAGTATTLQNTRTIWGQNFNGSANVTGSLTAVTDITGGASSMVITAGTGNSRTMTLRSTTSGGTATAFLTGNADQSSTFGGNISGTGAWTLTGGAGNMTIVSGTGNSRTMTLQTTTSGGAATTALVLGADQRATFSGGITQSGGSVSITGTTTTLIDSTGSITLGASATSIVFVAATIGGATTGQMIGNDNGTADGIDLTFGINILVNDGCDYFQELGKAGSTVADGAYCADQFYVLTQTSTILTNVTAGNRAVNAIRLTQSQASAQRMGIAQPVEYVVSKPYRSRTVNLSFAFNYSNAAAVRYAVIEWTGTADTITRDIVSDWTSSTYTAGNFFAAQATPDAVGVTTPAANTWTAVTLEVAVTSSCNNLIVFVWTEGTAAQLSTLDVSEFVLCDGTISPTWVPRLPAEGLAACQRYFCKTFDTDQACVQNAGSNGNGTLAIFSSGVAGIVVWQYPMEMRIAPAITTYNPAAANANWRNTGNTATITATVTAPGTRQVRLSFNGGTDQTGYQIHASADARL